MPITKNTFAFKAKIDHYTIFKQLEIFIKIVECNSLSLAAEKLNLAPSSISRSLKKLEENLGVTLIKRTTRNIILTDAGDYLYQQSIDLLSDLNNALTKATSFYDHPHGYLKITCSIAFGASNLMRLFGEYRKTHPDVMLQVDLDDQLINLNEEPYDIALRITSTPPDNLAMRRLSPIYWIYCGSAEYLKKMGTPQTLLDLQQHNCLVNPNVTEIWRYKNATNHYVPLKINSIIQANSSIALLQAALNHQGIVCLPTYLLGEYIKTKQLTPILLKYSVQEKRYYLYALYSPSKYSDPKIRSFIDFMLEKLTPYTPWDDWIQDYCDKNNILFNPEDPVEFYS